MKDQPCTISTPTTDDLADVARKLRMMAAVADQSGVIAEFSPAGARAVAEAIDGGGWRGRLADEVAVRVEADRARQRAEREAWVKDCHGQMAGARRHLARAQMYLGLSAVIWASIGAGLLWFA